MRAAARSCSASKYDITKAQDDRQVDLLDANASSLRNGMSHFLRIDLMLPLKRSFVHLLSCSLVIAGRKAHDGAVCCRRSDDVAQPAKLAIEEHGFNCGNPSYLSNFRMSHFVPPVISKNYLVTSDVKRLQ